VFHVFHLLLLCQCSIPCVACQIKEEPPLSIGIGDTVRVQLTAECLQPFQESPQLQLSFISVPGTGHAYPLRLPFAVCTFIEGVAMASPDFDMRWSGLGGEVRVHVHWLSCFPSNMLNYG
jgi:hypothetical protein